MRDKMEALLTVVGGLAVLLLLSFVRGWAIMLLVGVAHSYDDRIPALGFGATYALGLAVSLATYQSSGKSE